MFEVLEDDELPYGVRYPAEFVRVVRQGLVDLTPWYIMTRADARDRIEGLTERYPRRRLVPFARRQDNDDVACWDADQGKAVVVIHDYASPGWEARDRHEDFWAWFRAAVEDMIGFGD